jgi:hypothetical protein
MRRLNNINEEINRMKSLFTEERMFGNLVENEEVISEANLKVGSKGEGVKALQTLLGVTSDGIFGPKTKEAVMKMQKEAGLNADGIVGPKTLEGFKKKLGLNEDESDNLEDGNINALNTLSKEITGKPIEDTKLEKLKLQKADKLSTDKVDAKDIKLKGVEGDKIEKLDVKKADKLSTDKVDAKDIKLKGTDKEVKQQKGGTGTDTKGDSMSDDDFKKSKKGTTSERGGVELFGMKLDRVDIINNKATCRDHIKKMMKLSKNGKSREDIEGEVDKDGKEYIKKIEWCLSNFYNVFEKDGIFKRGSRVMVMLNSWNIPVPEKVSGGLEGERYKIKNAGDVIGIIKKVKPNKFRFRGKKNVPLINKSGKVAQFIDKYENDVYDALNIDKNKKKIVIQRSIDKGKMDMGTFVIANRK